MIYRKNSTLKKVLPMVALSSALIDVQSYGMEREDSTSESTILLNEQERFENFSAPFLRGVTNEHMRLDIMDILRKVQAKDHASFERFALPFIVNKYEREETLNILMGIPIHDREGFSNFTILLLNGIVKGHLGIINALKDIPVDLREGFEQFMTPFLFDLNRADYYESNYVKILKALNNIPANERVDFIQNAIPLIKDIPDGYTRSDIIKSLKNVPAHERENFVHMAIPLINTITNKSILSKIIAILKDVPAPDRIDFVQELTEKVSVATPLIEGIPDLSMRANILKTYHNVPTSEREDFIQIVIPFISACTSEYTRGDFIRILKDIPVHERSDFSRNIINIMKDNRTKNFSSPILYALKDVPIHERDQFIQIVMCLMDAITRWDDGLTIIGVLKGHTINELEDFVQNSKALLNGITNGQDRAYILKIFKDVPPQERENFVRIVTPLINTITCGCDRGAIFKILKDIPAIDREGFEHFALLLSGLSSGNHYIIEAVKDVPANERENFVQIAIPFVNHITDAYTRSEVLNILKGIPGCELEAVVRNISTLMIDDTNMNARISMLRVLKDTPVNECEARAKSAFKLMINTSSMNERIFMLSAFKEIPLNELENFVLIASPLLKGVIDLYSRSDIIEFIKKIPAQERGNFGRMIANLVINFDNVHERMNIINSLFRIPTHERESFVKIASSLLRNITNVDIRNHILKTLEFIPNNERESFAQFANHLINENIDDSYRIFKSLEILRLIHPNERETFVNSSIIESLDNKALDHIQFRMPQIPVEERASFVRIAMPLLKKIVNEEARTCILKVLKDTHPFERESFGKWIPYLLKDVFDGGTPYDIWAVHFIKEIPVQEREDFVINASILLQNISDWKTRMSALPFFTNIERPLTLTPVVKELVQKAWPFIRDIQDENELLSTLKGLSYISPDELNAIKEKYFSFMSDIKSEKVGEGLLGLLVLFSNHADNLILLVLQELKENDAEKFIEILSAGPLQTIKYLIKGNDILKAILHKYWLESMISGTKEISERISDIIVWNPHMLGITTSLQAGLYREALKVYSRHNPESNKRTNPHYLASLFYKGANPVDLNELNVHTEINSYRVGEENIVINMSLNPLYLQKLPNLGTKFRDLPPYSKTFLTDMISSLALKRSENNIIFLSEVEAKTNFSKDDLKEVGNDKTVYEFLIQESLGNHYLQDLLNVAGELDDFAPTTASKFIACVSHLSSLPNEREEGKFFSLREESFIEMLKSLHVWATDKDERIDYYYNNLPQEKKLKYETNLDDNKSKAREIINTIIIQEVEKMFSGNNFFIKQLMNLESDIGIEPTYAYSQAQYVKKLIGPEVGLLYKIVCDDHILDQAIVGREKEEFLQIFYNNFTPMRLVSSVMKKVNVLLSMPNNSNHYHLFSELLEPEFLEMAWDFDTLTSNIKLTELGAIHLLKQIGVLN